MEQSQVVYARATDPGELTRALGLVRRDPHCVQCDQNAQLVCPSCPDGQSCQLKVFTDDCTKCPVMVCVDDPTAVPNEEQGTVEEDDGGSGVNAGAIAGGVIGGLIVIGIIAYLAWRFFIKPRRSEAAHSAYTVETNPTHESEKDGASRMTRRSSTHTVHSIASTVLTRASNIIQIAYIPGVTNRANSSQQGGLVPPVPPIPMHHGGNGETRNDDQHFFVPGDLRDSTYSGLSGYSERTSYARTSYAPRSSIASTIYGKQAQVMTGTQTGMRAKPTMVSVKSVGSNGSDGSAPPVPDIDFDKFGNARPKSGASAFSVGSTFLNNANTATQARAQVVKLGGGGLKPIEIKAKPSNSSLSAKSNPSATPDSGRSESTPDSEAVTLVNDTNTPTVTVDQGPFSDPPQAASAQRALMSTPTLGAVMEADREDDDRDADLNAKRPSSRDRGPSPFGDEHATK